MNAVDTNVIIRLLTVDDPEQFRQSEDIFRIERVFIPDSVILETEWVLRYAYKFKAAQISKAFRSLFGLPNVFLQNPTAIMLALDWHENGLDFSDSLHLAQSQTCKRMLTFDKKFVKAAQDIPSIPVVFPPE